MANFGRCIHCLGRVEPPAEVCESCIDLLSDLGEDLVVEPPPRPQAPNRPFEPTAEDDRQLLELELRGAFRPFDSVRPKQLPSHARGRWGKAIEAEKRRPPR